MPIAHVVEKNDILVVTQANEPVFRDLRNTGDMRLWSAFFIAFCFLCFLQHGPVAGPPELLFLLGLPVLFLVTALRSVSRLPWRETFVFDRNENVLMCNDSPVAPLQDIWAVRAQVMKNGQRPMFRLILELPYGEAVMLVRTHDIPANGEFRRWFAAPMPWLDYDEQDSAHFLPPEIVELRQRILDFLGD